jgi:hypothetical protein
MLNKDALVRTAFHEAWGKAKEQPDYNKDAWTHVQKYLDYPAATRIEREKDSMFPPKDKLGIVIDVKLIDSEGRLVDEHGMAVGSAITRAVQDHFLMKAVYVSDQDTRPVVTLFNNVVAVNKALASTLQGSGN